MWPDMLAIKTMRPPVSSLLPEVGLLVLVLLGADIMYLAAAWAHRNAPFRFTSMILRHWEAGVEILGTQPTMPAKQRSMKILGVGLLDEEEGSELASGLLRATAASWMMRGIFSDVTSHGRSTMRASGKLERRS